MANVARRSPRFLATLARFPTRHPSHRSRPLNRSSTSTSNSTAASVSPLVSLPTGTVAGCLGGMCGVGGGVIIMPALRTFTDLSPHLIAGTSLFSVSLAASVGAMSYEEQGIGNLPGAGERARRGKLHRMFVCAIPISACRVLAGGCVY